MKAALLVTPLAFALASCASAPEAIDAQHVPSQLYLGYSCRALAEEYAEAEADYDRSAIAQRQAQQGDALGVFLVGIPVSSMTGGDREAEISYQKGTMNAVEEAARQKGCTITD